MSGDNPSSALAQALSNTASVSSGGYKSPAINPIETFKNVNPFGDNSNFSNDQDLFKQFGSGNTNPGELGRNNFDSVDRQKQEQATNHANFLRKQQEQIDIFKASQERDDVQQAKIRQELSGIVAESKKLRDLAAPNILQNKKSETLDKYGSVGVISFFKKLIYDATRRLTLENSAKEWAAKVKQKAEAKKAGAGGVDKGKGGINKMFNGDKNDQRRAISAATHQENTMGE